MRLFNRQPDPQIAALETRVSELASELETRDASYTDALISALIRQTQGRTQQPALITATGALEACAGKIGLAFAAAEISGPERVIAALSPDLLMLVGRSLIRRGELVLGIDTSGGQLRLQPAQTHSIVGNPDPATWDYELTLPGPSQTETLPMPATSVVHLRYATDPERPWRGIGPIGVAAMAGELSAETASALTDESSGPRGSFLPLPTDGEDETIEGLKGDIKTAGGALLAVESAADDWQAGGNAPRDDWQQKRFGPNPPQGLIALHQTATNEIYAACGLSSALFGDSTPAGAREAWRLALFGTIAPLGRLVETELRRKLDPDIRLGWDELRASDLSGRARAFQSMVGGGMPVADAAALAGLLVPED